MSGYLYTKIEFEQTNICNEKKKKGNQYVKINVPQNCTSNARATIINVRIQFFISKNIFFVLGQFLHGHR